MKKIMLSLLVCILLTGCTTQKQLEKMIEHKNVVADKIEEETDSNNKESSNKKEETDVASISFMDIDWYRDVSLDGEQEHIYFSSNGEFAYYCSCGNPVDDSDLYENYTYNESTHEVVLTGEGTYIFKIINYTDQELEIEYNGEKRLFQK